MTTAPQYRSADPGPALRTGTFLLTFWQLARVGLQALWMVLIARVLGAAGYGTFAGYAGLAAALGALTGLGFGLSLLQDVSRDRSRFGTSLFHAGMATIVSGSMFWLLFTIVANGVLGHALAPATVACIGVAELVAFPATILSSYAYQAHERPGMAGLMYAVVPMGNLVAVALYFFAGAGHSLEAYAPFHAVTACIAAGIAWCTMRHQLRPARADRLLPSRGEVTESAGFSLMRVIDTAMVSLDKSLVLRLAGAEVAGWYTVAFRLVSVLSIPVSALAMAALPRLFRTRGTSGDARLVPGLLAASFVFGVAGVVGMLAGAALLPLLLGPTFADAAHAARTLCVAPMLMGLTVTGANVLVTSDRRTRRMAAQICGLAVLYGLAVFLIPRYGILGAAIMLQGALAVTAGLLWLAVFLRPTAPTDHTETESR
ncbi:lipopolysaccharide biosynthesis protein [Luteibacter sp. NPDC031894]|uniref:lipopolysaccharide biosynthesis protein n=1 Tax=Luteibacter sp. NPDC031894 TaxID=3390572 RepID=UPI003CFD29BA